MTNHTPQLDALGRLVEFHLLGLVEFHDFLALQRRLAYEADARQDDRIVVLFCEHPTLLTVGRSGSREHIRLSNEELRHRQLTVEWVGRGGGCIPHAPGQLAIYPIAPLDRLGWSNGEYLRRLQTGVLGSLNELGLHACARPGSWGVWGRSGLLAAMGVSVRDRITRHGLFLNVNPPMTDFYAVDTVSPRSLAAGEKATMSCLLAEHRQPVKMTTVRAVLVNQLVEAFAAERHHLYTGHAYLATQRKTTRQPTAYAS